MANQADFQMIGSVSGHPEYGDLKRGDVLKLEVGDDGKPTSELFAARAVALGKRVDEPEGDGTDAKALVKDAKAEAKVIKAKASEDADTVLADAKAEAAKILEAANAEAAQLLADAGKK